jgi:uncharacterized membrane protein
MNRSVKFLGHPVHQMLIVFPLGLLATAVLVDLAQLVSGSSSMATVAFWLISFGLLGALVAAPFGLMDWLRIPHGTRARRIGAIHGTGNALVTLLFFASWLQRDRTGPVPELALVCSLLGGGVALVTAWLGGELVSRLGIGVYDDANPNAPSSLHRRAGPSRTGGRMPAARPTASAGWADVSAAGEEDPGAAVEPPAGGTRPEVPR